MRDLTDAKKIQEFMRGLGKSAKQNARVYFTGGATALLMGWRESTIDVDVKFLPESDELFRSIPLLKEKLQINVELASPADFIPALPGWEERSLFIAREGKLDFFHYDPYSQALAKIERGHSQDITDVDAMLRTGLIEREKLLSLFESIKPQLYRYPAINADAFSRDVLNFLKNR